MTTPLAKDFKESYELSSQVKSNEIRWFLESYPLPSSDMHILIYKNTSTTLTIFLYRTVKIKKFIFTFNHYFLIAKFEMFNLGRITPSSEFWFYNKNNFNVVNDLKNDLSKKLQDLKWDFKDSTIEINGYTEHLFINDYLLPVFGMWNNASFGKKMVKIVNNQIKV